MSNESIECPLCMEPMDFDDVDFYPCPCRYQICRFCWDKIINEENGLCPACRKPYNSEHPASYKPRTEEEIKNKIKHSKKVCLKKAKPTPEGKEYLTEYRVLQKNLIFVVGLPMRMADEVELLKGLEYFGKCGKVYKIVINQNQTFPGPQGTPCLSAYVTYHRNEDALKTLVDLKKLEIDGRAVKLSLGTTKYCSQFLRNRRCTKQDCMYLHEMGDQAASFTKEDMANGKHTEYENQLIQEFFDNQKQTTQLSSSANGILVSTINDVAPEKVAQRKTSLSSQPTTTCANCILTTMVTSASSTLTPLVKSQRTAYNCQITPIGTDPSDASKIYSISSENCHSKTGSSNSKTGQSPVQESLDINHIIGPANGSQLSDLPFMHTPQNISENTVASHSLLDSFYYLNSQVTSSNSNQQVNNSNISNYSPFPYRNEMDFARSFGHEKANESTFKDTADIDFDPINISRMGLAELIATENSQKSNSYLPQIYAHQQRNMLRQPPGHEYMMQSSNNEFYNNSNNNAHLNHRVSTQSFLHNKQMNIMANSNNTSAASSATVAPLSSGFPSPPPGFEVSHNTGNNSSINNGCMGETASNDIMNMLMSGHSNSNNNNVDMYSRYQNQHSGSDIPMGINHHSSHFTNQYSIPSGSNYHNEYSGFSNGGGSVSNNAMMAFNDLNSQNHPWKTNQSVFCDGDQSHPGIRSSLASTAAAAAAYNRSHSMNENTGIRNQEWNGFTSYSNDSPHIMNNFQDGNNFLLPMRGQSVQCASVTTSGNDAQLYVHRQQTSHSVNH